MNWKTLGILAAAVVILTVGAGTAGAAVLHVANNGTDSATCGPAANPCRSVSQAIAKGKANDRIVVGPGRYGDLNGNGILGEPGEETGGNCSCMVAVSKRLTLESEEGAGATILDAGPHPGLMVSKSQSRAADPSSASPGKASPSVAAPTHL